MEVITYEYITTNKSTDELEAFRGFYLDKEPNLRNYAMICMGVIQR